MTDPDIPDEGGSDYGYDLAHDVPRGVRTPARPEVHGEPQHRRDDRSPLSGGDYGYDEAHGGH
jgi:hypothetical protein